MGETEAAPTLALNSVDQVDMRTAAGRTGRPKGRSFSPLVTSWFVIDAIVALAPPLYWAADGRTAPILGVPTALFYFLAVDLCITASIIVAYADGRRNEGTAA